MLVLKENLFGLFLKIVRKTLFKKRTTAIGQKLSSTLDRTGTSRVYSWGSGWRLEDGKLLRGNIKARWIFARLTQLDSCWRQSRMIRWQESGMRNLIGDQGRGGGEGFIKLTQQEFCKNWSKPARDRESIKSGPSQEEISRGAWDKFGQGESFCHWYKGLMST